MAVVRFVLSTEGRGSDQGGVDAAERTRNGEKYVTEPPPVRVLVGAAGSSYWNVRGVGTAVIAKVPAKPPPVVIVTTSPTERLCGEYVLIVAVVPTALAPGTEERDVPPPVPAGPSRSDG